MAISSGKGYSAASFALELEGKFAGILRSVEGGGVHGEVVEEPPGPDGVVHKHLGGIGYDDLVVTTGSVDGPWGDWLKAFLEGKAPRHDGAVTFLDYNYVGVRRIEFRQASIASLTVPALEGSTKTGGFLTVVLRPESTVTTTASGSVNTSALKTKTWMPANFVVQIPGVDCSRVSAVGPLTVTQAVVEDDIGSVRTPTRHAAPLRVGDLVLTIAQSHAGDFASWSDDFIVRGNSGAANEKTATVHLKTPSLKDDVFSLELKGVGIHRFEADKQVKGAESISRVVATMYCEEVALVLPEPVAAPAAPPAERPATSPEAPDPASAVRPAGPRARLGDLLERLDPADVARRLRSTAETVTTTSADAQHQRGALLGAAWAERVASLDELSQVAELVPADWTAVALDEGHSLVGALQESGVVPAAHSGDLELSRDPFVEGLVEGATAVYAQVRTHLERPDVPRT